VEPKFSANELSALFDPSRVERWHAIIAGLVDKATPGEIQGLWLNSLVHWNQRCDELNREVAKLSRRPYERSSEKTTSMQCLMFDRFRDIAKLKAEGSREEPITAGGRESPPPDAIPATIPEEMEKNPSLTDPGLLRSAVEVMENTKRAYEELDIKKKLERALEQEARRKKREEAKKREDSEPSDPKPCEVPWPAHLRVETRFQEVPPELRSCGGCGETRTTARHERNWQIEVRVEAYVVDNHRPVLTCRCRQLAPVTVPVPPKPLEKSPVGMSVAAEIVSLRSAHQTPVRQITGMLNANGVPVSEGTVHAILAETGERLAPVAEAILHEVQSADAVNIDDTPVLCVVGEGEGKRERKKARVWVAAGGQKFTAYLPTESWKGDDAEAVLGPMKGVIQGDGYAGFPRFAKRRGVGLAGCMAHLRRKFIKALEGADRRSVEPLFYIRGLYEVESLARRQNASDSERLALRQKNAVPIMSALLNWGENIASQIEPGSSLGKAWTYLKNQQIRLQTYLSNGHVEIDNNRAERELRPVAIGRQRWLFFRSWDKLKGFCAIMSVVRTAQHHGLNIRDYLTWLLQKVAQRHWSPEAARALLPAAYLAATNQPEQEKAA
jgi:hypothetical protein